MPIIEVPFRRVAVDLVGPIQPATSKGNRYILTIVDYATRYPEAVALKGIETERVAEALVDVFCRVGVPKEMLTDMGSQFTSELMAEVSRLLSIRQLTTTPYHPMCNGLVERFNGTSKQILRRLCSERPADWDKYLSASLFTYRDAPQESLGFSPFELVYGHEVRGPMKILWELWTKGGTMGFFVAISDLVMAQL
jgi:transposase InsO family protein